MVRLQADEVKGDQAMEGLISHIEEQDLLKGNKKTKESY